jgi:hypothetical protein
VAGVNQSTVSDQRGGLFEALCADAEVVAPDAINAGKPLGDIPVEIVDVAADDNSQQVVATEYAKLNVDDLITTPQDARDTVRAYSELGFDRLLFHPAVASLDQVDRLADAVL